MDQRRIEVRLQLTCLFILTAIAVSAALHWLAPVMIPFILAVMFTYILRPIAEKLMKWLRIPRWPAIGVAMALGVLLLLLFGVMVSVSVRQLAANADAYRTQFNQLVDTIVAKVPWEQLRIDPSEQFDKVLTDLDNSLGAIFQGTAAAILNVLSNGLVVLVFMIFLLLGQHPGKKQEGLQREIEDRVVRYINTMVFVSAMTGILVWLTLTVLGVDMAIVFGLLTFLLNFIPNIGSVIAVLLPVPVVLLDPEKTLLVQVLAIGIPAVIQFGIGNVLAPKMMGESLNLHPVVILMALIFFGMLWGIVGMFLATPITAVIKILFDQIEATKPFALLMAGDIDGAEKAFREET